MNYLPSFLLLLPLLLLPQWFLHRNYLVSSRFPLRFLRFYLNNESRNRFFTLCLPTTMFTCTTLAKSQSRYAGYRDWTEILFTIRCAFFSIRSSDFWPDRVLFQVLLVATNLKSKLFEMFYFFFFGKNRRVLVNFSLIENNPQGKYKYLRKWK